MTSPAPGSAGADYAGEIAELLLPPAPAGNLAPLRGGQEMALSGETMGTRWSLSAVAPEDIDPADVRGEIERMFALVIAQMSQWEPGSEINRFNDAPAGARFVLSPQFALVLDCALGVARASDGAFDPTLGAASDLWGFGAAAQPAELPSDADVRATRRFGWRDVAFSPATRELVQSGRLRLDLSGIAKGFAVDLAVAGLERLGIAHALMEVGGELRAIGVRADGLPWWVDLEMPPDSPAPPTRIGLTGWAVATSGSYRRRREAGGRTWQHTLDPRTGLPVSNGVLAASVLHPGCMQADALAGALMVLGPDAGMAFANAHGIPARIVALGGIATSAAWNRWLA